MLSDIGVPYTVVPSEADEQMAGDRVEVLAEKNALAKVHGVQLPGGGNKGAFVLGTDTLVSLDERIMGKPKSEHEATEMIAMLAGRKHRVVSGVALARLSGESAAEAEVRVEHASTEVAFGELDDEQVTSYVDSGEWRDKAGGYAVQGLAALFVRGIEGEYSNVVGLPLHLMSGLFGELGFDLVRQNWSGATDG